MVRTGYCLTKQGPLACQETPTSVVGSGGRVLRVLGIRRGLGAAGVIALIAVSLIAPSASSKPTRPPTGSTCPLPATDLCTAYVTRGYRWPTMPLPYYINLAGAPAGAEQDIHDAFL